MCNHIRNIRSERRADKNTRASFIDDDGKKVRGTITEYLSSKKGMYRIVDDYGMVYEVTERMVDIDDKKKEEAKQIE